METSSPSAETSTAPAAAAAAASKIFEAYKVSKASPPAPHTFELGLVMAGAVSAGAYTAGIVDFLFTALDSWYDAGLQQALLAEVLPAEDYPVFPGARTQPLHDVRLKTMAGASAGGMCAVLTAISALEGSTEKFYQAWVEDIDIAPLLDPSDLTGEKGHPNAWKSVLNCQVLDEIARTCLIRPAQARWPKWMASDQLDFFLTLTNLNGLTYEVTQTGGAAQRFTDHADRMQFRLLAPTRAAVAPTDPSFDPALFELPSANGGAAGARAWDQLGKAALSTGAFPVALLSRIMTLDNPYYERRWYGAQPRPPYVDRAGAPDVKFHPAGGDYLFVDGGMTNNEPLELARRALTNDPSGLKHNDPDGKTARRAVVMIDPFPSDSATDFTALQQELGPLVARLFAALLNQSRFRAEDLLGALDLDVHSRFIIAPLRECGPGRAGRPSPPMLACGTLQAFGGFLHKGFRQHDYALGRYNCQRFLQRWFTLDDMNPLFERWPPALKQHLQVRDANGQPTGKLPILPLLGPAVAPVPAPEWAAARMSQPEYQQLSRQVRRRVEALTAQLSHLIPNGWWAAKAVYPMFVRGKLRDLVHTTAMGIIHRELKDAELLED
ncbi:patatin-like phospholipase family protein [Hymenobacter sp. HD11105]